MNENYTNPQLQEQEDEIDLMEYARKLFSSWRFLLKWGIASAVVALILVIDLPKTFTSTAVLAPEISQKGGGSLNSLAALAGVNLGSMSTSDAMSPEVYPQIVQTAPFLVELFSVPVQVKVKKDVYEDTDLYTYIKEYKKSSWWRKVISAPGKALKWCLSLLRSKEENEGYMNVDPLVLTYEQEGVIKALRKSINVSVEKKTFLITVSVSFQDARISKQVADIVVQKLQDYVTRYRTEKARRDVEYYTSLNEKAKAEYYEKQDRYARYVDMNQGLTRQSVLIERERLQNESSLAFNLFNNTAQQLQLAQAKVQMETPVVVVIQPASVPLKGEPSKAKSLIVVTFLFFFIGAAWVLFGDKAMAIWEDIRK